MGEPTDRVPDDTELTVSVVPEMEPVRDAAGLLPTTLVVATVCVVGVDTVYVPTPPDPLITPVTTVPGMTPGPVIGVPTAMVPALTDDTVSVLPEMEAVITGSEEEPAEMEVVATVCGVLTV